MKKGICFSFIFVILPLVLYISPGQASNLPVISGQDTVNNGDSVTLTCTYNGSIPATASWLKLGEHLLPDGVNVSTPGRLLITSANHEDHAGLYRCVVPGIPDVESAWFNLTVQYFEGHLSICQVTEDGSVLDGEGPVYTFSIGANASFMCCYGSAYPNPELSWKKKNEDKSFSPLVSSERVSVEEDVLSISGLSHSSHNGEYECVAAHPTGKKSFTFYLFVPPPLLIKGKNRYEDPTISIPAPVVCAGLGGMATLRCEVTGDATEIYWSFKGNRLTSSMEGFSIQSDKLVVYRVDSSKIGVYRCHVFLKYGDDKESSTTGTVELDNDCIKSASITTPNVTVGVGKSFQLECDAVTPLPESLIFTWILPNGSRELGSTLQVIEPGYSHNGIYTCIVDNEFSEAKSAVANVAILGPLLVGVDPMVPAGKLNDTLRIICWSNTSSASFFWRNGTGMLHTDRRINIEQSSNGNMSVLSINRFTVHDASSYSCEAQKANFSPVSKDFNVVLSSDIYLLRPFGVPSGDINTGLTVVCPVAGGEGNLTTTWLKNNTPILPSDKDVLTGMTPEGLPTMTINVLSLLHEYIRFSCLARDSRGTEREFPFSITVTIPGQFKGTTLDENYTVNPGDDVVLNCEVMGKPMPPITWNFYRGDSKSNPKLMNRTFPNGSILIDDVQNEDIGRYLCIFYLRESNPQVKSYTLNVRQLEEPTNSESSSNEDEVLGLAESVFIAIVIAAVGVVFLAVAILLCVCLLCRYCCCKGVRQNDSETPRIALETTSFERKPSMRGSYRFKDNSGILQQSPSNISSLWTFQGDGHTNSVPMTTASSVAVSPGPPIPSPVPTTPAGPTTSMVTTADFKLPSGITSFSRENLKLDNVMGEGEFGPVFKGVAQNIIKGEEQSLVAVKVLIRREGEDHLWPSLMEFANQMKLSSPFIASILGISADTEPFYVIYNYLDRGDLKKFLINSRPKTTHPPSLTQAELLQIATQVAQGMAYLYKQQIIHGDLATRNCLISSNLTVKIADLGIGHDLYPEDYYDNGTQLLPIRWMAPELFPEASEGPSFSLASDVWSFGVFCWEVFAYARQPYDELSDNQVIRLIPAGHVLNAPEEGCPPLLFSLMQDCLAASVEQRPFFTTITSAICSISVD